MGCGTNYTCKDIRLGNTNQHYINKLTTFLNQQNNQKLLCATLLAAINSVVVTESKLTWTNKELFS